ncbi:hypothetical protein V8F33_000973 [Rhypophila sp. PSN 637]
MTQQIPLPAVLVGSGDPISGPCYLAISGLPEFTKWQDLADFLRYKICPRLDVYVSLNGPNNTSGWIRVIGLDMFARVDRVLRECPFKGHRITHHDPGYNYAHGFGAILIHEPFDKDKHLFLSSDILLSPVPRQSPTRDPVWVWPQALPPPPAVQYPLTPSSPSHSGFWDFTPWRYAQGMPYQTPPHPPPSQYVPVHPQMQTPSLPSTHPPTPPWFCQSPLAERNQYHQTWPQAQVHTQLAILENSHTTRPCTHWNNRDDHRGQSTTHQRHHHHSYSQNHGHNHAKQTKYHDQSPQILPPPNNNKTPPNRRERLLKSSPQNNAPFPREQHVEKKNETININNRKLQSPTTKSPQVLIVDGTSRRPDEKDNPGQAVGVGLGLRTTTTEAGPTTTTAGNAKVLVVIGSSSRDLLERRQSTGYGLV